MPLGDLHRILAIDDVPSNLLTLRAILPSNEFLFVGASGAEEAFRLWEQQDFDLVLLDVLMPGLDGYDVARRIKANPRTAAVPVIFLTSLKSEDEVVKGFEAGAVDFLSKPFYPTELLLRLHTHLALKDKNEALETAAEDLRQANQARDRFFSILAHDLKNPFAGFLSLVQEVLNQFEKIDREELHEVLLTMGQTSQNVYRLLETLLDWGRSQTGALTVVPQPLLLSLLIEEAFEPLEESYRRKRITLIPMASYEWAKADRATVVILLRNLLSNALKFSHPGGEVRVEVVSHDGMVDLVVRDNGIGIPPTRLPLLFLLENKISTPGTAKEPGTGLGLILCAEFAQKNQGSLRAESVLGKGSTFILSLPSHKDVPP